MEIDDLIYAIREIISDVAIETEQDSESVSYCFG